MKTPDAAPDRDRTAGPGDAAGEASPRVLAARLEAAGAYLRKAAALLPTDRWTERPSAAYSPVGWHLGHAAAFLARWVLPADEQPAPALWRFFDPVETPKDARGRLPDAAVLLAELDRVHERAAAAVLAGRIPLTPQAKQACLPADFLVRNLIQHELQHAEHVAVIAALLEHRLVHGDPASLNGGGAGAIAPASIAEGLAQGGPAQLALDGGSVQLEGGQAVGEQGRVRFAHSRVDLGSDDAAEALDNERGRHQVELRPFWIARDLVTVAEWSEFLAAGGYRDDRHWSPEGRAFRDRASIEAPLGWVRAGGKAGFEHPQGAAAARLPVCGVSWFEADAYARFCGARLPTEAEREHAAGPNAFPESAERDPASGLSMPPSALTANVGLSHSGVTPVGTFGASTTGLRDLAGNVWEWTASWFNPYPGFEPYPYDGYSVPWFGETHRVLRGGSWATSGPLCRRTFRNWYDPAFRELPAGLRCAGDLK